MTEEVKKGQGRPKAQKTEETVVMETPTKSPPKNKAPKIRRKESKISHCEYEIPRHGGIVFLLPQKGVTIYDKDVDTVREIRYCPNEPSIYVDEQSDNALKEAVAFRNSRIFVPKEKPNLRKFLDTHPSNMENGGSVFKKIDTSHDAEKELEKEFLLSDAVSIVRDRDINDLLSIAIYFGININTPVAEIRFNLLRIAKTKTEEFLSSLDSPQVTCRSTISQAGDYQILNVKNDGVYWFDSNKLIVSVPVGQDAVDTMVRFCLTEKGASTLSLIEDRLERLG